MLIEWLSYDEELGNGVRNRVLVYIVVCLDQIEGGEVSGLCHNLTS